MRYVLSTLLAFLTAVIGHAAILGGAVTCGGAPVPGVKVSDGKTVVVTGPDGRYSLTSDKALGLVFITVPSGYVPSSADGIRPDFFAHLSGDGDEVHDFILEKQDQRAYSVLFVTDIHLTATPAKEDIRLFREVAMPAFRKVAAKAAAEGPVYTFNLGDLSHERYWYQNGYDLADAFNTLKDNSFPTLLYSVPGNHDNDCAVLTANTDTDAGHLYRKVLGPEYYSVDIGREHWLFLDDIVYENDPTVHKKPWPQGSAGSISYSRGFTRTQMAWLEQDLATVPSDRNLLICTHSPILIDNSRGTVFRESQMDSLSALFARFGKVTVYAGHMHRMERIESRIYPLFSQCTVSAFSGDMWESAPNRLLGVEGEEGGTLEVRFGAEAPAAAWHAHSEDGKVMRCYDLNRVGRKYRRNKDIRRQMAAFPKREDYADDRFRNGVLVNYWMWRPGEKVSMYENGNPLEVKKVKWEDPLFNLDYYVGAFLSGNPVAPSQEKVPNRHMFAATAASARSTVRVVVTAPDGTVLHEETIRRPKAFGPRMR